jgi:hypothetical protein
LSRCPPPSKIGRADKSGASATERRKRSTIPKRGFFIPQRARFGRKSQVPGTLQQDLHHASQLKRPAPRINFELADFMSRFDLLIYICLAVFVALSGAAVWAALFAGRDENDRDDLET